MKSFWTYNGPELSKIKHIVNLRCFWWPLPMLPWDSTAVWVLNKQHAHLALCRPPHPANEHYPKYVGSDLGLLHFTNGSVCTAQSLCSHKHSGWIIENKGFFFHFSAIIPQHVSIKLVYVWIVLECLILKIKLFFLSCWLELLLNIVNWGLERWLGGYKCCVFWTQYCSCPGPGFVSQHLHRAAHNHR